MFGYQMKVIKVVIHNRIQSRPTMNSKRMFGLLISQVTIKHNNDFIY